MFFRSSQPSPSMQSPANAATAAPAAPSPASSPASTKTCEPSAADRDLFWAQKFKNYVKFIQSIAVYAPEVQPWASALRITPLCVFQLHVETVFKEAIRAHQRGDNEGRDHAASAVVRTLAAQHGLEVLKLSGDDYAKLLRSRSLFTILAANDSLM